MEKQRNVNGLNGELNKKSKKKGTIRTKLLITPLILILVGVMAIGLLSSYNTKESLFNQMKSDGLFISEQFIMRLGDNQQSLNNLNLMLESKIRGVGKTVVSNQAQISNAYLVKLAEDMDVDEINYTDSSGNITF